jgi:hypothetical protein
MSEFKSFFFLNLLGVVAALLHVKTFIFKIGDGGVADSRIQKFKL